MSNRRLTNDIECSKALSNIVSRVHSTSQQRKSPRSQRAPIVILCSPMIGLAFALCHHFLYLNFDQRPVSGVPISQSWLIRSGTFLAFLTKLCFVLSVSTAYVQLQWLKLRNRVFTIQDIDAVSNVLNDILGLFDGRIFVRFPILAGMACICWILPILPILTPATMLVLQSTSTNVTQTRVPELSWTNTNVTTDIDWIATGHLLPIVTVSTVAVATAITGYIYPMTPKFSNSSYTLTFTAPALKCQEANQSIIDDVWSSWKPVYNGTSLQQVTTYLSWVPGDPWYNDTTKGYPMNLDVSSTDNSRIFIMTYDYELKNASLSSNATNFQLLKVTECTFWNASYTAEFLFSNGIETVNVQSVDILSNLSFGAWHSLSLEYGGLKNIVIPAEQNAYAAVAASFGSLLVGLQQIQDGGSISQFNIFDLMNIDFSNIGPSMERTFQNMIMSYFNEPAFLNTASAPVNVLVTSYFPAYSYASLHLFLIYGLGLFFTLLCSAVGMYAYSMNQDSYQNVFSSFFRATSNCEAQFSVESEDTGADPRPKNLATVVIDMTRSESTMKMRGFSSQLQTQPKQLIERRPVPTSSPLDTGLKDNHT